MYLPQGGANCSQHFYILPNIIWCLFTSLISHKHTWYTYLLTEKANGLFNLCFRLKGIRWIKGELTGSSSRPKGGRTWFSLLTWNDLLIKTGHGLDIFNWRCQAHEPIRELHINRWRERVWKRKVCQGNCNHPPDTWINFNASVRWSTNLCSFNHYYSFTILLTLVGLDWLLKECQSWFIFQLKW